MIKVITLSFGMNVIGEYSVTDNGHMLKKPALVLMQQQQGQTMIGFSPFLDYTNDFETGVEFVKDSVVAVTTPNTDLQNEYSKYFGTGIQIATADILKR